MCVGYCVLYGVCLYVLYCGLVYCGLLCVLCFFCCIGVVAAVVVFAMCVCRVCLMLCVFVLVLFKTICAYNVVILVWFYVFEMCVRIVSCLKKDCVFVV